jgi:hypothetical protein
VRCVLCTHYTESCWDSIFRYQYSATQQMHIANGNPNTRVTYENCIQHLQDYSSLEDKAHPMRQRRHSHSARLEKEEASAYFDTSSKIMDLLALWPSNTHLMGHHVTMVYTIFYLPPCRPLLHVLWQRIPYPNDALSTILIMV